MADKVNKDSDSDSIAAAIRSQNKSALPTGPRTTPASLFRARVEAIEAMAEGGWVDVAIEKCLLVRDALPESDATWVDAIKERRSQGRHARNTSVTALDTTRLQRVLAEADRAIRGTIDSLAFRASVVPNVSPEGAD